MRTLDVMLRHLPDASIHRQVIVSGGDNHVYPLDETVFINLVVVNQGAPRRFGHADAFKLIWLRKGAYMFVENLTIMEELLDAFDSVQNLNQPRVVLVEGAQDNAAPQRPVLGPLLIGLGSTAPVDDVQTRKRTHTVDPVGITQRLENRRLEVRKRFYPFGYVILVTCRIDLIQNDVPGSVHKPKFPVVVLQQSIVFGLPVWRNESHKQAREISERADLVTELFEYVFEPGQGAVDQDECFGDHPQHFLPLLFR